MKKIILLIVVLSISLVFFSSVSPVFSQDQPTDQSSISLDNPLNVNDPNVLIGQVINSIFGIVGSLALLMFIYGGLIWMTSAGSQEKIKKGKDIILWSVIGLTVIFSAYALVRFVIVNIGA